MKRLRIDDEYKNEADRKSENEAHCNAACREQGVQYSRFIEALNKSGIALDRKVLSDMAVNDSEAFVALVKSLNITVAAPVSKIAVS